MKSKFLIVAIVAAMIACLPGCKSSIPEMDVLDLANKMTPEHFEGSPLRTRTVVKDARMTIHEWRITDVEAKKIQHVCRVWGDGADSISPVAEYTYAQVGLAEGNNGMNYVFTGVNVNEVLDVLFWGGGIVVKGDTILNTTDDIESLNTLLASFPNNTWRYFGGLDTIFRDTIVWDTVYFKNVKYYDEALQRWMLRKDTVVEKKEHLFVNTLPVSFDSVLVTYASEPEKNELIFKGMNRFYVHNNVVREAKWDTTIVKVPVDTIHVNGLDTIVRAKSIVYTSDAQPVVTNVNYTDNWYFNTFTSKARFTLLRDGESSDELVNKFLSPMMRISGYDQEKGKITIGAYDYKLMND